MATIDFKDIVAQSLKLAKDESGKAWKELKPFAEHEFQQFSENAVFLAGLKLKGVLEDEELKLRLEMQRLALKNVLLAVKGIGLVTAEKIVNGVLGILTGAITEALNVVLPFPVTFT